jgi:transcriptional regulator with XRE-family HTH domain
MIATMERRRQRLEGPHPLRLWREHRGLSQQAFAEACRVSQPMVSQIEAGLRVPLNAILERLLDYTGLPAEAFLLPKRFLEQNPNFLQKYGRRGGKSRRDN